MKIRLKEVVLGAMLGTALVSYGELVAEYKFETGSGSTAFDTSGNNHHGTIVNPSWVTGENGNGTALEFTGPTAGSQVGIPNEVFLSITNEISIALWMYGSTNQPLADSIFGGLQLGTGRGINAHTPYSNGTTYWDCGDRYQKNGLPEAYYKGQWAFWVFTKNTANNSMKIYVNGQQWGSGGGTTTAAGITSFKIGSGPTGPYYDGVLDEFQIYDHELSLAEIAQMYDPSLVSASIERAPAVGEGPLEVYFDGSESFAGNGIVEYLWDFGDSSTASGMLATNVYVDDGNYTATLSVVDTVGVTNTTTASIVVDSPFFSSNIASMVYIQNNWETTNYPSVSSNDLAQTAFLTNTYYSQSAILTNDHPMLFDGLVGTADDVNPVTGYVRFYAGDWIEVEFDLTAAPFGYDLTEVTTVMGWGTAAGGRSNQGYDLIVTYVDGSTETIAAWNYWNPNVPTTYWTGVTLEGEAGGGFVSGVKAVKIAITAQAIPGGWVLAREFDFFGTPTVVTEGPVISSELLPSGLELSWESIAGAIYSVQSTEDLVNPAWATLPDYSSVLATPPMNVYTAAVDSAAVEHFQVIIEN